MEIRRFCTGRKIGVLRMGNAAVAFVTAAVGLAVMPYHIYITGAEVAWIYAGIFVMLQVAFGWMSFRMMRYARKNSCVYTVPSFFRARFGLGYGGSAAIALLMLPALLTLYSCILSLLGGILSDFGIDKVHVCIILLAITALGVSVFFGIRASFAISIPLMIVILLTILAIVTVSILRLGLRAIVKNTIWSDITGSVSDYINIMKKGTRFLYAEELVNYLSYGLMVFGFLPLLNTFLAAPTARVIKNSRRLTALLSVLFFVSSAFFGGVSRAILYPRDTERSLSGYMKAMFDTLFQGDILYKIIGGLYVTSLILLIVMICCVFLNVIVGIVVNDIIAPIYIEKVKDGFKRRRREDIFIIISCVVVTAVATFAACGIEKDTQYLMLLFVMMISIAVGPAAFISLFMKKTTGKGLAAGFILGTATALLWEFLPIVNTGSRVVTFKDYTGVNLMLPGFIISTIAVIVVSLLTWKPDKKKDEMFDEVKNRIV